MKRLFAVAVLVLSASVVSAQSFVRPELFIQSDGVSPQLSLWLSGTFNEGKSRHGVWFWGVANDGFAEGIGGYSVYLNRSIQLGMGVGPSTEPGVTRWNPFVWIGHGRISSFLTYEDGAGDPWYMVQTGYEITKMTSAGFLIRKYVGVGPFMQFKTSTKREYSLLTFAGINEGKIVMMVSVQRDF